MKILLTIGMSAFSKSSFFFPVGIFSASDILRSEWFTENIGITATQLLNLLAGMTNHEIRIDYLFSKSAAMQQVLYYAAVMANGRNIQIKAAWSFDWNPVSTVNGSIFFHRRGIIQNLKFAGLKGGLFSMGDSYNGWRRWKAESMVESLKMSWYGFWMRSFFEINAL